MLKQPPHQQLKSLLLMLQVKEVPYSSKIVSIKKNINWRVYLNSTLFFGIDGYKLLSN